MTAPFRQQFDASQTPLDAQFALALQTKAIRGTGTNDSAPAGFVGEFKECLASASQSATVTISNASPGVVTDTGHGMSVAQVVNFTTTGGLPTGLTVGTNYYVSSAGYATNSYQVTTTVADALAGTNSVNTSSAGSGTHTRVNNGILASVTNLDVGGLSLTAGDWDVHGAVRFQVGATTTINSIIGWSNNASATLPNTLYLGMRGENAAVLVNSNNLVIPSRRFSLSATTSIFLSARSSFGTSTNAASGAFWARRAR